MICHAEAEDLPAILELQYLAYRSEAELLGNWDIPPLKQKLSEVEEEFRKGVFLKLIFENDAIVGSVRAVEKDGAVKDGAVQIGKLMVHPQFRRRGYGRMLLSAIEAEFAGKRCVLFTSTRSVNNIRLYESAGYRIFEIRTISPELQFAYMEKQL